MARTTLRSSHAASLLAANVGVFIEIKNAYDECPAEIREVIDEMLVICASSDADEDQKRRAMHTVLDSLFPSLAEETLRDLNTVRGLPESRAYDRELDAQEYTFAERLRTAMQSKGWTQERLAEKAGVGQSAISNMLNRQSRPQARTVFRLAKAIGVPPNELWPNIND